MSLHISTPTSPINKIYPSAQASWTPLENPPEILPFDGYLFYPFLTFRQEFWNLSKATRKDSHYRNQWLGPDFDIFWCFFCVFVFILMFFFVWFYLLFECFFVCVFVFTLAVLIICWSCQANELLRWQFSLLNDKQMSNKVGVVCTNQLIQVVFSWGLQCKRYLLFVGFSSCAFCCNLCIFRKIVRWVMETWKCVKCVQSIARSWDGAFALDEDRFFFLAEVYPPWN